MIALDDLYELSPTEFERVVGDLFKALGYEVSITRQVGDEGVDLNLIRGDERSLAQCKRYRGTVGQPLIRDFYGAVVHERAARGYLVTTGLYSVAAQTWAAGKNLVLVDGVDLAAALNNAGLSIGARPQIEPLRKTALTELIATALKARRDGACILIAGAPPARHNYRALFKHLQRKFQRIDFTPSHELKQLMPRGLMSVPPYGWVYTDARVRVIDEFDALSRALMEEVLRWQHVGGLRPSWSTKIQLLQQGLKRDGGGNLEWRRLERYLRGTGYPFVLVATSWERRIPKSVVARFSTVVPAHELDWDSL